MSVVCTVKPCSNIIYSIHYVKLEAKLLVFHIRIKKFFLSTNSVSCVPHMQILQQYGCMFHAEAKL